MNIEIANRLYQYRQRFNLSQEELAEKLGISRQAVSKWERAEASPDTENLINLAKLYGVTIDELLNKDPQDEISKNKEANPSATDTSATGASVTDTPVTEASATDTSASDTSATENKSETQSSSAADASASSSTENTDSAESERSKKTAKVILGKDGIQVQKNDSVVQIDFKSLEGIIGSDFVKVAPDIAKPVKEYKISLGKKRKWIEAPVAILVVIAYLVIGSVWDLWHPGWLLFPMIPVISGVIRAIEKRRLKEIPYPIVAVVVFLLLGFLFELWHPGWIIFLTIPVFYWLAD